MLPGESRFLECKKVEAKITPNKLVVQPSGQGEGKKSHLHKINTTSPGVTQCAGLQTQVQWSATMFLVLGENLMENLTSVKIHPCKDLLYQKTQWKRNHSLIACLNMPLPTSCRTSTRVPHQAA